MQKTHSRKPGDLRAQMPCVLVIAGSDSSGGAGIQADLRALAACGVHGLSAVTAVTAQTPAGVASIHCVPARAVSAQIDAAFAGFRVASVKIGMLGNARNIIAVAASLRRHRARNVVLDPVLASSSGTPLLASAATARLRQELLPLVDVLTPNIPEAERLVGRRLHDDADRRAAARELLASGARAVLLKGGHANGRYLTDVLATAASMREFRHARLRVDARGTGCTLAALVAAGLARGMAPAAAAAAAERMLQSALRGARLPQGSARRVLAVAPARRRKP